jgi:hypothetical protein
MTIRKYPDNVMSHDEFLARRGDPKSSKQKMSDMKSTAPGKAQQIVQVLRDYHTNGTAWATAKQITKKLPGEQERDVSRTLTSLYRKGAVVRREFTSTSSGRTLLHFRLPRVNEKIDPPTEAPKEAVPVPGVPIELPPSPVTVPPSYQGWALHMEPTIECPTCGDRQALEQALENAELDPDGRVECMACGQLSDEREAAAEPRLPLAEVHRVPPPLGK